MWLAGDAAPGGYQIVIGWYGPETMQRLPAQCEEAANADRVLLAPVRVE